MMAEQAIERIKTTGHCTAARARAIGLRVGPGAYVGTGDDRADRWYVETFDGPVDRRGPGYATREAALAAIADEVARGIITGLVRSEYA